MIRPLAAMPAPPAQPNNTPTHDASASFLDWVLTQGGSAPAGPDSRSQPSAGPGASALPGGGAVPPAHGLSTDPFGARERTDALSSLVAHAFAPDMASSSAGLALRVEHHAGPVEIIALPWRLVASGGLAHASGLHAATDAFAANGLRAQGAGGGIVMPGVLAPAQMQANASTGQTDEAIATASPFESGTATAVERVDEAEADAHMRAEAPEALPWVARLLRWLDDHGEATLWVRDFRLDDGEKRALVATLRTAAAQSGFRLDRIVINGRAHWHVHRPARETSHAG